LLASRLARRLDTAGSTEYALASSRRATPSRLRIYRLRAWAPRTSASASSGGPSGWTSPRASDAGRVRAEEALARARKRGGSKSLDDDAQTLAGYPTPAAKEFEHVDLDGMLARREKCKETTSAGNGFGLSLGMAVPLWFAGYPTPQAADAERASETLTRGEGNPTLLGAARLVGWQTPRSADHKGAAEESEVTRKRLASGQSNLPEMAVTVVGWVSPGATDYKGKCSRTGGKERNPAHQDLPTMAEELAPGETASSRPAGTASPAASRLNPSFSLWLQGYPRAWDRSSPGWPDWLKIQKMLTSYYAGTAPTGRAD
jgi:hypothetical protein